MSEDFCRWRGEVEIREDDDGPLHNSSVVSAVVLDRLEFFDADPHAGGDPVLFSFIELLHGVSTKLVYKPRGDSGNFRLSGFVERILHNSANVVNFDSTHHNRVSSDEDETILSDDTTVSIHPVLLQCMPS
ncbi:Hypothetical protein, putative [Bodo saltans]|uniref:Uncharacterized protein n=1 Tax=Bodo saltans TaxID=75058 RepID=A0A0S4JL21_BODSA|nr:Hypothetical protein, putative [Bodo saltans]|eukprot:CUG90876.1 Hypothetical protein, putative [Bodo saltans]